VIDFTLNALANAVGTVVGGLVLGLVTALFVNYVLRDFSNVDDNEVRRRQRDLQRTSWFILAGCAFGIPISGELFGYLVTSEPQRQQLLGPALLYLVAVGLIGGILLWGIARFAGRAVGWAQQESLRRFGDGSSKVPANPGPAVPESPGDYGDDIGVMCSVPTTLNRHPAQTPRGWIAGRRRRETERLATR
jgi:hypothetical protein